MISSAPTRNVAVAVTVSVAAPPTSARPSAKDTSGAARGAAAALARRAMTEPAPATHAEQKWCAQQVTSDVRRMPTDSMRAHPPARPQATSVAASIAGSPRRRVAGNAAKHVKITISR